MFHFRFLILVLVTLYLPQESFSASDGAMSGVRPTKGGHWGVVGWDLGSARGIDFRVEIDYSCRVEENVLLWPSVTCTNPQLRTPSSILDGGFFVGDLSMRSGDQRKGWLKRDMYETLIKNPSTPVYYSDGFTAPSGWVQLVEFDRVAQQTMRSVYEHAEQGAFGARVSYLVSAVAIFAGLLVVWIFLPHIFRRLIAIILAAYETFKYSSSKAKEKAAIRRYQRIVEEEAIREQIRQELRGNIGNREDKY